MARTYGEIIEASFETVFAQTLDREAAVFVDIGSGKGVITSAAAQEGNYAKAVGIEKYKDKYDESTQLRACMPEDVRQKLHFTLSDIADLDLRDLIQTWSQPEVMLFCNNLAFGHGMNGRYVTMVATEQNMCESHSTLRTGGLIDRRNMPTQVGEEHKGSDGQPS